MASPARALRVSVVLCPLTSKFPANPRCLLRNYESRRSRPTRRASKRTTRYCFLFSPADPRGHELDRRRRGSRSQASRDRDMSATMRIGMVVPTLGFSGGIERHARDLATSLAARGHEVVLLHGERRGRDPEDYARAFHATIPMGKADCARGLDVAYVCRHRRRRVPLSTGSPVSMEPAADADSVLRISCREREARVVGGARRGGAAEYGSSPARAAMRLRVARVGSLSRARSVRRAR